MTLTKPKCSKQPNQHGRPGDEDVATRKTLFGTYYSANPGDAKAAYYAAGYQAADPRSVTRAIAALLKDPVVQAAIQAQALQPAIASREERQAWWTRLMRGQVAGATILERIKASELLGKSQGDFVQRVEVVGRDQALAHVRSLLGLSLSPSSAEVSSATPEPGERSPRGSRD